MTLTQERLKQLLRYDPETGLFYWRKGRGGSSGVAGTAKIYTTITINERHYFAHVLAWLYMTGEWPASSVDHKDTDKKNNAWDNLRLATLSQNKANVGIISTNKTGLKGVSRYRAGERYGKPWQASIRKNGKSKHLGHFATVDAAHAAYVEAAKKMFGEFARAS